MKKLTILAMILMGVLVMGACGNGNNNQADGTPTPTSVPTPEPVANLEGTLPEIIEKIYAAKESGLMVMTMELDLTNLDMLPYYTGLSDASKIKEAAVSESAFGSQAYSLVLVRLNDAADAEEVANLMKDNIDTRKWVCVNADDVRVAAYGDVIMFIMTSTEFTANGGATALELTEAFKSVCGGELSVDMAK